MSVQHPPKPIELFYSYSHKDEKHREKLDTHLTLLKRQGVIAAWHDRRITAGQEWANQIDEHLNTAQIILLLVSADFLASDYCYDVELKRAMERHEAGEARVIPIILRPCDWHSASFGKLQALPKDAKPINEWSTQDKAYLDIAQGIRRVAEERAKACLLADDGPKPVLKCDPNTASAGMRVRSMAERLVSPRTLVFSQSSGTQVKDLYFDNSADEPLYGLSVVIDTGGIGGTNVRITVPKIFTVTANDFNPVHNSQLIAMNVAVDDRRYLWIYRRRFEPNSKFRVSVQCDSPATLSVIDVHYSHQDDGVNLAPNGSTEGSLPLPERAMGLTEGHTAEISNFSITLMKD